MNISLIDLLMISTADAEPRLGICVSRISNQHQLYSLLLRPCTMTNRQTNYNTIQIGSGVDMEAKGCGVGQFVR